jgi:class 3 adenylate cyclase
VLGLWWSTLAAVIFTPLCWSALWFSARRKYGAAQAVTIVSCIGGISAWAVLLGPESGVQYFLLVVPPCVYWMLPPWKRRAALGVSVAALLLFAALEVAFWHLPPWWPRIGRGAQWMYWLNLTAVFAFITGAAHFGRVGILLAERQLMDEQRKSDLLLLNILPEPIAKRLKTNPAAIADGFPAVSVLFADIVNFTTLSSTMAPDRVVTFLNEIFSRFDELATHYRVEKIKTIGDCYMVAAGLPTHRADHAAVLAEMALDMRDVVHHYSQRTGLPLQVRVGINSGPVVAGVIGKTKYIYDLWGDTVNTASRMESHGLPGSIQITDSTCALLQGQYLVEQRGTIDVKGKGAMSTHWLMGRFPAQGQPV